MAKLKGSQFQQIQEALLGGYIDSTLQTMVRIELNEHLGTVAGGETFQERVFSLIDWAERTGRLEDLIEGACLGNPTNPALQNLKQVSQNWFAPSPPIAEEVRTSPSFDRDAHSLLARPSRLDASLFTTAPIVYTPEEIFGRDQLIDRVVTALVLHRKVLLAGMGGIGKTTVAAAVAEQHIKAGKGGVIWLNCRAESATEQFEAFDRLCVRSGHGSALQHITEFAEAAQLAVARSILEKLPASLLVLDDARDGAALSSVIKAVPESMQVLVTSRHRFALNELIDVGELTASAALELLAHNASTERFDDSARARELCELLGCHAYALEIAGKTLKVDDMTPGVLLGRIAKQPHTLPMPEEFADIRHQSVKSLLDESYEALDEVARTLLRTFGMLFAPGASVPLLATCAGLEPAAVEAAVTTLRRRSLAERGPSVEYYTIHDLTFSYASTLTPKTEEQRQHVVESIQKYVAAHAHDFELLEADQTNILTACELSDNAGLVKIVATLAIGGYPTAEPPSYFDACAHTSQFLPYLKQAVAVVSQLGDDAATLQHYLLSKQGNAHLDLGESKRALATYKLALACAPSVKRQIVLLAVCGRVLGVLRRFSEAADSFRRARSLVDEQPDDWCRSFVLEQETYVAGEIEQDYEKARQLAQETLELAKRSDDPEALVNGYQNLGTAEFRLGIQRARAHHLLAQDIAEQHEFSDTLPLIWEALGRLHHADMDHDHAQDYLVQAVDGFNTAGKLHQAVRLRALMEQFGYRT